jgi:hypothetical protein
LKLKKNKQNIIPVFILQQKEVENCWLTAELDLVSGMAGG